MRLFSGLHRASGKPFVTHLVGTASVLATAGAPLPLVLAGLLHAAYVQGRFGDGVAGATPSRRALLVREIGAAEQLVYRYATFPWRAGDLPADRNRIEGLDELDRQVVIVRLANEVEEAVDFGILFHSDGQARKCDYLRAVPVWAAWARAVSQDSLARALEEGAEELSRYQAPELLPTARDHSFRPAPLERPTLSGSARSAAARLLRIAGQLKRSFPRIRTP